MGTPAERPLVTLEEFLSRETEGSAKHEYVRGEVFAMAGATKVHNDVVTNVSTVIKAHLRGGPCRAYVLDVKLYVEAADAVFYPDLVVTCDPSDRGDPLFCRKPVLIIEVLSDSTAAYDRGEKFDEYRKIDELGEYVLVDSRQRHVVVYRKGENGAWEFAPVEAGGDVGLRSIGLSTPIAGFYDDTDVPERLRRSALVAR